VSAVANGQEKGEGKEGRCKKAAYSDEARSLAGTKKRGRNHAAEAGRERGKKNRRAASTVQYEKGNKHSRGLRKSSYTVIRRQRSLSQGELGKNAMGTRAEGNNQKPDQGKAARRLKKGGTVEGSP